MAYLTLSQVKAYWPKNEVALTSFWDTMINTLCTNVSDWWDAETYRVTNAYAVSVPTTLYYDGKGPFATDFNDMLPIDELASVSGLAVSLSQNGAPGTYTVMASTDYITYPYNATNLNGPITALILAPGGATSLWPTGRRTVQVTGLFGYSTSLPNPMLEALLLWVIRMVRKGQQNYMEVGTIIDMGQAFVGFKEDPDIKGLIRRYRHRPLVRVR